MHPGALHLDSSQPRLEFEATNIADRRDEEVKRRVSNTARPLQSPILASTSSTTSFAFRAVQKFGCAR